jgi:hypothetical protein
MKKIIEVNLGIGLNQFFPEPVKILVGGENEDVNSENTEDTDESNND